MQAHRRMSDTSIEDIVVNKIEINDILVIFPHEVCPVDGEVIEVFDLLHSIDSIFVLLISLG